MTAPARSRNTDECICPEMPIAATRASAASRAPRAIDASVACHHASGSCSAQPGCGVDIVSGDVADATTSPLGATRIALTPLVPTSSPRKSGSATSAHSEQELHRQLVEPLVARSPSRASPRGRTARRLNRLRGCRRVLDARTRRSRRARASSPSSAWISASALKRATFSLRMRYVRMLPRAKSHTPCFVFGAVGVAVEVPHAGPLRVLEQLHEEERRLRGPRCRSDDPDRSDPASAR